MPESKTADIIPFPTRAIPAAAPANNRLARALTDLDDAVTAQRAAMAAWRTALGDLRTVTKRLGGSLRTYHDNLGRLDARVNALRATSTRLEVWADEAMSRKP